ncbi:MAG: TetR/AcrR family transcriptional regulator [Sphingomonadaceae bacterium]
MPVRQITSLPFAEPNTPRRPERANGRRRYEMLLDAAERLLERDSAAALTIQNLAREADVPMASVYHFFPSAPAVSIALSERYMAAFAELVMRPILGHQSMGWQAIIALLFRRAVRFYQQHPYAQTLVLGSDHSWQIRRADMANNRRLAQSVAQLIGDDFSHVTTAALIEAIVVSISMADGMFTLSIIEHGAVTPECGDEVALAVCAYLEKKFAC